MVRRARNKKSSSSSSSTSQITVAETHSDRDRARARDVMIKSVHLVLNFIYGEYRALLYYFEIDGSDGNIMTPVGGGDLEPVKYFYDDMLDHRLKPVRPLVCERLGDTPLLYFLLNRGYRGHYNRFNPIPPPPEGIIYDPSTRSLISTTFTLPSEKPIAPLISAFGKLYHFTDPCSFHIPPHNSFEVYDPSTDSWDELPPFPFYSPEWSSFYTIGHAVCSSSGCIIFSFMSVLEYPGRMMLFDICGNKWHEVYYSDDNDLVDYFPFEGKAVVVNDLIHLVVNSPEDIIIICKLSINTFDGGEMSHFLHILTGIEVTSVVPPPTPFESSVSRYLTFLGGGGGGGGGGGDMMFCLFKSVPVYEGDVKYVCATTFRIEYGGEDAGPIKLTELDSKVIKLYHRGNVHANVSLCFTPDDCGQA